MNGVELEQLFHVGIFLDGWRDEDFFLACDFMVFVHGVPGLHGDGIDQRFFHQPIEKGPGLPCQLRRIARIFRQHALNDAVARAGRNDPAPNRVSDSLNAVVATGVEIYDDRLLAELLMHHRFLCA